MYIKIYLQLGRFLCALQLFHYIIMYCDILRNLFVKKKTLIKTLDPDKSVRERNTIF